MSSLVWRTLYSTIRSVNRSIPRRGRRTVYPDTLIVAMYFWSVLHDRPLCWAAQRQHCRGAFRPRQLPSRSQFCRRLKNSRCQALLDAVFARLALSDEATPFCYLDGRALPVGPYTKDPDAARGYRAGGWAWGYKLHAIVSEDGRFILIRVEPLNVAETTVAREMMDHASLGGILLADGNYDDGKLYDAVAQRSALLFTPLPDNAGGGHRPQSWSRLLAAAAWENGEPWFYSKRREVERYFGQLSAFGGGLAPLPAWVRTLERVRRWVAAKITIYHARLTTRGLAA